MRYLYILLCLILLLSCENKREEKYARWNAIMNDYLIDYQEVIANNIRKLKGYVFFYRDSKEGRNRIDRATEFAKDTDSLLVFLKKTQNQIKGKDDESLKLLLLGKQNDGKAYEIKNRLLDYQKRLLSKNKNLGLKKEELIFLGSDSLNYLPYQNSKFKNLSFIESNFIDVAKNEALNNLFLLENKILMLEEEILKRLGASTDPYDTKGMIFEQTLPKSIAKADTIFINEDYKAMIYLWYNIQRNPELYFQMKSADFETNDTNEKLNKIQIKTSTQGEKTWQAQIKCRNSRTLQDSTFPISQKYSVLPK